MTRKDKLLKRFLRNPQALRYGEIEAILLDLGFIKSYGKGSHRNFRHSFLKIRITIPIHHNDCLPYYKQKLAKTLKHYLPNDDN